MRLRARGDERGLGVRVHESWCPFTSTQSLKAKSNNFDGKGSRVRVRVRVYGLGLGLDVGEG